MAGAVATRQKARYRAEMALEVVGEGYAPLVAQVIAAEVGGCSVPDGAASQIVLLLERIAAWNRRIDLTAARSPGEHTDLVLADALAVLGACPPAPGERWVDVGTGAGAPGLTIALLAPRLSMTLVEPRAKRVAFLRSVLAELGRLDVQVVPRKSSSLAARSFDVAISRATLPPEEWLGEGARLARRHVWLLLARGAAPAPYDAAPPLERDYRWPLTGVRRRALRYEIPQGAGNDRDVLA